MIRIWQAIGRTLRGHSYPLATIEAHTRTEATEGLRRKLEERPTPTLYDEWDTAGKPVRVKRD